MGTDTGAPPNYHCDNCSSQAIKLPFSFCFYGKQYDTVYINNKGDITFVHPEFSFSSKSFPLGNDTAMLAVFYSNVDDTPKVVLGPPNPAYIYYKTTPTHLIVQWSTMGYNTFDDDIYNNFQVTITNGADTILPVGNNVSYCYWKMQWASGDSGSMGFDGIPSTVGINKGDGIHYAQFGAFDFPGYTYQGPFDTNSQVYWLNEKSLIFNTCVSGNTIPPVIIKPDMCDTVTVCAGDTTVFITSFLCPQQGQTAMVSPSSKLSGLTSTTTNANAIYKNTTQLIAALKDTGTHLLYIVASDNSSPFLKDSISYLVTIKKCGKIDTGSGAGVSQITWNSNFSVYPNPNNGEFTIQSSSFSGQSLVEVYNILGEKIYSKTIGNSSSFMVNIGSQPSGLYFYHVIDASGNIIGNGKFAVL